MNKDREIVTIVIPVRNRKDLVVRTLESVVAQTYRPLHLIVVDNNSTDSTMNVLEGWSGVNRAEDFQISLLSEMKPGAAAARNCGLRRVKSDKLLFFDSDDEMVPTLVEDAMSIFEKNRNLDVVFWRTGRVGRNGKIHKGGYSNKNLFKRNIYNAQLSTQSFMVRKEFIDKAGGWNESLLCWDDWELGLRLLLNRPRIKGINKVLSKIYPQEDSITGVDFQSKAGLWEQSIDVCEEDVNRSDYEKKGQLLSMLNYRRMNLAALYRREGRIDLSKPLLKEALSHPTLNFCSKVWIKLLYHYTALGGRGAYLLWL